MKRGMASSSAYENCGICKKKTFLIVLSILLIISSVSALEIRLSADSYQPGETLNAEITGNFVSLKIDNVLIYNEGVPRPNPVISDLTYQDGTYYFYAILPREEGNFSLRIEDSQYFEQENLKSNTIVKNFTIKKTNQSSFSINPGFIITDNDFSIRIKSLKDNQDMNINFEATQQIKNISLIEGIETSVEFSISDLKPMKTFLLINNYKIPVFIVKAGNETLITEQSDLKFYPSEITGTLLGGNSYYYELKLVNIGEKNLTGIEIFSNIEGILEPDFINSLKTKSYEKINFTITPEKEAKNISGKIMASVNKKNASLDVLFRITEKKEEVNISTGSQIDCNDIGKQCADGETCNGVMRESKQGPCCIGGCIKISQPSSYGFYIGILVFIVVIILLFFLYSKIKKKQKPKTTEEFLKERSEEYRNRTEGREVNKRLDRI
ncbi:MAG: hypothetical protein PHF67_03605 [Candidatus Nanoarchaeia archaeon]|nr:hypothetical protein [Candidatus Nanoarchaeia archaeon]